MIATLDIGPAQAAVLTRFASQHVTELKSLIKFHSGRLTAGEMKAHRDDLAALEQFVAAAKALTSASPSEPDSPAKKPARRRAS